jgi:superfamily I DNA/RNA helicase
LGKCPNRCACTHLADEPFFIFTDPNQAVYRSASTLPILDAPFLLTENCRNTDEIHKAAYSYYSGDEVDPPGLEGAPPEIIEAVSPEQQAKRIKALVSKLIQIEKVSPQDIAVLVLDDAKETYFEALARVGNPTGPRWSFEALWVPSTVLVDTARRFKGLEAGIVILCGVEQASHEKDAELLYVSLSRARSRLFLVGSVDKAKYVLNR